MGLDITVYTNLEKAPPEEIARIAAIEDVSERWEAGYDAGYETFYINPSFPEHSEGLEDVPYKASDEWGFRAGSYSGYNTWRNWLAEVVGTTARRVWQLDDDEKPPFYELINFSDCEGTIGPKVAAKLAKDFDEHEEEAKSCGEGEDGWYFDQYKRWQKAFHDAAQNGAVNFH